MSHSTRRKQQLESRKATETIGKPIERVGIPPAPECIFKNHRNRMAPAQDVWGQQGTISYVPIRAEYIKGKGNFVYYKDVPYPSKCVAPVEAIHAMAGAKRLTINAMRFLSQIHKKGRLTRLFEAFNDTASMMVEPYYLDDEYYCTVSNEVRKFVKTLLVSLGVNELVAHKTGEIMGMFFEYDNAYRWRIQDLVGEADPYNLVFKMPKELERLVMILKSRETHSGGWDGVFKRFKAAITVLKYLWWFPPTRKRLKKALAGINLDIMKMDDADIYHSLLYGDYNVRGKNMEERYKILQSIHGTDESKWPPRILIRPPEAPRVPVPGEKITDFVKRITGKTEKEVLKMIEEGNLKDTSGQVFTNPNLVFTDKGFK